MSETEPSPQSEAEKEEQGVKLAREIAGLQSRARTESDYEAILEKTGELKRLFGVEPSAEEMEEAKEIMGEDFLGPEEVKKAFGIEITSSEIPPIPFSKEELERAKELNQLLVLRVGRDNEGNPLTMQRINELAQDRFDAEDKGKVLLNTDWYKEEEFFKEGKPALGWALVSKENISDSTSKNYLEQTELLIEYLETKVFAGRTLPTEYQAAIKEFEEQRELLEEKLSSDWKEAAKGLEELKITHLLRQSPAEMLYDLVLYFQNRDERLLPNLYSWASRRSSDGDLVVLGGFGSGGVGVDVGADPAGRLVFLGAGFSRSL